jgi:hypothetical protein
VAEKPEINNFDKFNKLYNEQAPYALNNAYYTEVTKKCRDIASCQLFHYIFSGC